MKTKAPLKEDILTAAERIRPYIHHTPIMSSAYFNQKFKADLYFKCENFQKAGAFKSRGACNAIFSAPEDLLRFGVATHSSGNHAAALSRAASLRKVPAYIVMPENALAGKIEAVRSYGGIIRFCRPTLEARETTLNKVMEETSALEIHPYNDLRVIAGQATAALELIQDIPGLDLIIAPLGGGGLLSGTALAATYFSQGTKVYGIEPVQANDAFLSFESKSFIPSKNPNTLADGLRTSLGDLTFPIILDHVEKIVTVTEASIIAAMRMIWERMKIIVEPSSAVPFAAILDHQLECEGKKIGIIVSGGNADLDCLPWNPSK